MLVFDFSYTRVAELFIEYLGKLRVSRADNAHLFVLFDVDGLAVTAYFDGVAIGDAEHFSHFLRYYYSAELVNVSYNSFGFHCFPFVFV